MKKLQRVMVVMLGLMVLASTASAITVQGTVYQGDFNGDTVAEEVSVSSITFDVTAGTTVAFDVLAYENTDPVTSGNPSGTDVDLNGDGEFTYLDSYLRLFSGATQLASNDDGAPGGDGSISIWDSYLSYTFTSAGSYTMYIGDYSMNLSEALQGYTENDILVGNTGHADWQMTFVESNGTLSNVQVHDNAPVPEPATLSLLGMGLVGLVARARRKKA